MRLCYVLLSPTWGMHQYTADLANRMAAGGHDVHLVTTQHAPADRYGPAVTVHKPVSVTDRGFSRQGLAVWKAQTTLGTIRRLGPDVVHVTGPHLWNPLILTALRWAGIPTIQTIHDLHPHAGAGYGRLLYIWNAWVRRAAGHLLVHGKRFRQELVNDGMPPVRVTCTPLTHLFLSHEREQTLVQNEPSVRYDGWALFIGRLERYKGLEVLVEAARRTGHQVVIAGPGKFGDWIQQPVPPNVEIRNRLVDDEEAIHLFRHCSLVILPYIEASQSALIAAAYFFRKPVIVTQTGALAEYVVPGDTGWVIEHSDPGALAEILTYALSDHTRLERMGRLGHRWYERYRKVEELSLWCMYHDVARGL